MQSESQTRSPRLKYRLPTTLVKGRHSLPSKHMHPLVLWCSLGVLREVFPALPDGAISFNLLETETQNPHVYSSKCLANSHTQSLAFAKLISPFSSSPVLPLHLPRSYIPQVILPSPSLYFQEMDYQSDTSLNVFYNMEAAAFLIHPILLSTCIFSSPRFPGGRGNKQ